ncbi:hypothetical protein J2Y86_000929 [Pseudomonas migulae]|uniref:hypothetical protein n=1 Tax=Pseudomonas migulae TaxID=78543 RepID=UPI0020A1DCA4|nr:hypothetical protein [Pseudomonas migulae]MCP1496222.1 hypothetical protein [Pseudomonas migulae]
MIDTACSLSISYKNERALVFGELEISYALSNRRTIIDTARELRVTYVVDVATTAGTLRIPMQSFQTNLRSDALSTLVVFVPGGTAYKGKVLAGQMMFVYRAVKFTDGTEIETEISRAKITDVTPSLSPNKSTMTISGTYEYAKPASPKSISLSNIKYVAFYGDEVTIRSNTNSDLQPGDIVNYDGTDYVAMNIYMGVEISTSELEVRCAPR